MSTPSRTAPSPGSVTSTSASESTPRYAAFEFTEDPFRNYRYEDPFNIVDPFDEDTNGNIGSSPVSSPGQVDPFGFASSPVASEKFSQPLNEESLFGDDFGESFQKPPKNNKKITNKNVDDMSNNNIKSPKTDLHVRNFSEKSNSKERKHFWNKDGSQHHKSKEKESSFFTGRFMFKNTSQNGSNPISAPTTATAFEDQQLSWAAAESMRMEEDRRRRQDQENADLALALALSKLDSGDH